MFKNLLRTAIPATFAVALVFGASPARAASLESFPDPAVDVPVSKGSQTAVLAGGCFWCTEAVFEQLAGVKTVVSGYSGGDAAGAHYEIVSAGKTNHAESIEITFDPAKITYGQILKIFFSVAHDPTTLDRQGPDYGHQYRSAIFYKDADQKKVAEAYIKQIDEAKIFKKPIVTEVSALKKFYPAEEYHQDFVKRNPNHPYVRVNAFPKLDKLKKYYSSMLKKSST
jgi:peptide-methionine (S)-S-oxide reductase